MTILKRTILNSLFSCNFLKKINKIKTWSCYKIITFLFFMWKLFNFVLIWSYLCCVRMDSVIKAFLSNFYFFTKRRPFKNCEKCFLFHLKSFFRSRDIQIFVIFPLLFYTLQIQKNKCKWNNLWCHELVCINLQV